MRWFTAADCARLGDQAPLAGSVIVLGMELMPTTEGLGQLHFCTGEEPGPLWRNVHTVSLNTGDICTVQSSDVLGVLRPELLPDTAKLQLSQIRPPMAQDLRHSDPQYSGYCFLEDGRYTSGVWLCSPEEAAAYVKMQAPYQHRIMLCDRDDFCVLEMKEGRLLHPARPELDALLRGAAQQEQTGGITMI